MNFFDVRQEKNLVYGTKYFSDPPHIHSAIWEFFARVADKRGRCYLGAIALAFPGGLPFSGTFTTGPGSAHLITITTKKTARGTITFSHQSKSTSAAVWELFVLCEENWAPYI